MPERFLGTTPPGFIIYLQSPDNITFTLFINFVPSHYFSCHCPYSKDNIPCQSSNSVLRSSFNLFSPTVQIHLLKSKMKILDWLPISFSRKSQLIIHPSPPLPFASNSSIIHHSPKTALTSTTALMERPLPRWSFSSLSLTRLSSPKAGRCLFHLFINRVFDTQRVNLQQVTGLIYAILVKYFIPNFKLNHHK